MTIPIADAVNKAIIQSSSERFFSSCIVMIAAGTIPLEPAVGEATILPMEAFTSPTEIALINAPEKKDPHNVLFSFLA